MVVSTVTRPREGRVEQDRRYKSSPRTRPRNTDVVKSRDCSPQCPLAVAACDKEKKEYGRSKVDSVDLFRLAASIVIGGPLKPPSNGSPMDLNSILSCPA